MKMKTNNLPAVLLAVIMAAAMIMCYGLLNQVYADDDAYLVEITPEKNEWIKLPGQSIKLTAGVYYDFEGEFIQEQSDMDFRWEIADDDAQFARIKSNAKDPNKATLQFKDLPEGQTEIDAVVEVKVTVYSDDRKLTTGYIYLAVSSDFYQLYPDIINTYTAIGETDEVVANVVHYTMDDPEGTPVENVEFTWTIDSAEDATVTEIEKTPAWTKYEIKRLTGKDTYLGLEAKWQDGEETRYEYNDYWLKDIPTDLNDYMIRLPNDIPEWQYFVDDDFVITQDYLKQNTNVYLENLLLDRDKDYDLAVYKYDGWDEETGETYWIPYEGDLKTDPKGSEPDRNGEPTEGTGYFKVTAKAKEGSLIYTGETEDWAEYIYLCSNKAISGWIPDFYYSSSYAEYLDDEPFVRYDVKPGTILDPTVTLNEKELEEGVDYSVWYVGLDIDYLEEEFPTEPGSYEAFAVGKGEYYGTTFSRYIKVGKTNNDFSASGKTIKIKVGKKNKKTTKKKTFAKSKAFKVSGNKGSVTYEKTSGNSKITVSSAGKITVKKGLKKGTYKVKVKVTDGETVEYFKKSKTVTVTVKVIK
jgi:hypothetical protein